MARTSAVTLFDKAMGSFLSKTPTLRSRPKVQLTRKSAEPKSEDRVETLNKEVQKLKLGKEKIKKLRILNEEKYKWLGLRLDELKSKEADTIQEIETWKKEEEKKFKEELAEKFQVPDRGKLQNSQSQLAILQDQLDELKIREKNDIDELTEQLRALKEENQKLKATAPDMDFDSHLVQTPKQAPPVDFDGFAVSIADNRFWTQNLGEEKNSIVKDVTLPDGKRQIIYVDGRKEIHFPNGVMKEIHPDGWTTVTFANGDKKLEYPDGRTEYSYAESQTTQTNYKDGTKVFKFSNGQVETHKTDGSKEVVFPNGAVKKFKA